MNTHFTFCVLRFARLLASVLLSLSILAPRLSTLAQTPLTANGLAAFVPTTVSGGGGPNTWFDSTTATPDGTLNSSGPSFMEWVAVSVTTGGTANKLRIHIDHNGHGASTTCKLALYNSGGTLLASGTGTVLATDTDLYLTVTISDTVISSGTYYVAFAASADFLFLDTKSGANGPFHAFSYSSFPPSTLPTEDGHVNQYLAGVFVQ